MITSTLPKVNITQAQEVIATFFYTEREFPEASQVVMLHGSPGQGKSAIVKAIKEQLTAHKDWALTGFKGVKVLNFRLTQKDPMSLQGVPAYLELVREDGSVTKVTEDAIPIIFPIVGVPESGDPGYLTLIFLDEFRQAPPVMQNLGANLIDRIVGNRLLDKTRSFIVAATNKDDDNAAVYSMPSNVANRVCHLELRIEKTEWMAWALENKMHPSIVSFIENRGNEFLNQQKPEEGHQYATPRTWELLSNVITTMEKSKGGSFISFEEKVAPIISGYVGQGTRTAFLDYAKNSNSRDSFIQIIANPEKFIKNKYDSSQAISLIFEFTFGLRNIIGDTVTEKGIEALDKELTEAQLEYIHNGFYFFTRYEGTLPTLQSLISKYLPATVKKGLHHLLLNNNKSDLINKYNGPIKDYYKTQAKSANGNY